MGVSLTKGGHAPLSGRHLSKVLVALGWRSLDSTGRDVDLDASALMVGRSGRVLSDEHFVFFNNLKSADESVEHKGDDRVGAGAAEQDCETILIDLAKVPSRCVRIVFPVSIYDSERTGQTFGQVRDAYIRVVDEATAEAGSAGARQLDDAATEVLRGRTAIVVAHRLSQASTADRIVVLDHGKVAEQGTHEELLALGGQYATLWSSWSRA